MSRQTPNAAPGHAIDSIFEKCCRDGGIRTHDLLLSNQLQPVAGRSLMSPVVPFTRDDAGWDIAQRRLMTVHVGSHFGSQPERSRRTKRPGSRTLHADPELLV